MDGHMSKQSLSEYMTESATVPDIPELSSESTTKDPRDVIREFLPMIRRIARGFSLRNPSSLDVEDLTSAGVIGLLGALARFDSNREIKFWTFAEYRIRGMMLDEMRALDWIPRSVRARNDQIRQVSIDFVRREGRPPARDEIAVLLGITQQELDASSACETRMLSLDDPMGSQDDIFTLKDVLPDEEQVDPYAVCASSETNHALEAAIGHLSDRQQEVMQQYYFQGLTMKEIGQRLGLTESGVCRIHGEALRRLQVELKEYDISPHSKERKAKKQRVNKKKGSSE